MAPHSLNLSGRLQATSGKRSAAYWLDWFRPRADRRWLIAAGGAGAVLAVAVAMIVTRQPPRVLADTCGTANCHRAVPGTSGGGQAPPHRGSSRSHPRSPTGKRHPAPAPTRSSRVSRPTASAPAPTSTAAPSSPTPSPTAPTRSPTPTPSPTKKPVKVSYTLVSQLFGGFQGQFTIVNQASTPIDNWELAAELPGDHIQSVWFGIYHTNGDTLFIDPGSDQRNIGAGQSVTENFIASGPTTAPTSCTFNGSPC